MRKGGREEVRSVRCMCDVCAAHGDRAAVEFFIFIFISIGIIFIFSGIIFFPTAPFFFQVLPFFLGQNALFRTLIQFQRFKPSFFNAHQKACKRLDAVTVRSGLAGALYKSLQGGRVHERRECA